MKTIRANVLQFKNHKRIGLSFEYDKELIREIRKLPDCRWDPEGGFWHIHFIENHINYLNKMFKGEIIFLEEIG